MTDYMIDVETLSKRVDATILSIAAVRFDPRGGVRVDIPDEDIFTTKINLNQDRHIDPDTLTWWLGQSEAARDEVFGGISTLRVSLSNLSKFLLDYNRGDLKVWAQGANSFDIPILEHAYTQVGFSVPWKYYNVRDTRTVYDLAGDNRRLADVSHVAWKDAAQQCCRVQENVQKLLSASQREQETLDEWLATH